MLDQNEFNKVLKESVEGESEELKKLVELEEKLAVKLAEMRKEVKKAYGHGWLGGKADNYEDLRKQLIKLQDEHSSVYSRINNIRYKDADITTGPANYYKSKGSGGFTGD